MSQRRFAETTPSYYPDDLDLLVLEKMIEDSSITFKRLATLTKSDQRTIAKRYARLRKEGIVKRATVEVDWSRLGLTSRAFMGTATSHGEESRKKLVDFIRNEPRILEAFTTLGSHEYFMVVLDTNMDKLRSEVGDQLEPLTMGLSTSVVVRSIKHADDRGLLNYLRGTRMQARSKKRGV